MSEGGFVAVLIIDLHFPEAGSLKAKRKQLQSIKAQLHGRLGAAVAETDHHEKWQRATLTAALSARTATVLAAEVQRVQRFVHERCPEGASMEQLLVSVEDLRDTHSSSAWEG